MLAWFFHCCTVKEEFHGSFLYFSVTMFVMQIHCVGSTGTWSNNEVNPCPNDET